MFHVNERSTPAVRAMAFLMLVMLSAVTAFADAAADRQRADDLFAASRFKEAIVIYEELIKTAKGEDELEIQKKIAYCCLRVYKRSRVPEEYLKLAEMKLADIPTKANAYYNAGNGYRLEQKYEESLGMYDKAINLEGAPPDTVSNAWMSKGHGFNKLDRPDDAMACYRKGADVTEAHFVTRMSNLVALGSMHQNAENYREAEAVFKEAIVLGPNHHYGHVAKNRLIECQTAQHGSDAFYIDPYVTHLTEDGADIYWISRHDAPQGTVTIRRTDGQDDEARVIPAGRSDMRGRPAFRQTGKVSGLEADTQYTYTIECDGEKKTGSFRTAPLEPSPIRFAVLGDTQGGHERHLRVAKSIAAFDPQFVLHVGDCVEQGDRWDEWKVQLFDPGRPYLSKSGFWPARGNHDGGGYYSIFFGREDRGYEDFRYGNVHVFVMDSQSSTGGSLRVAQLKWLEESMGNSDARWKIVTLHHPMVHNPATEPLFGTEDFLPMLEKHGADVVLTGHYHIYQRLLPMAPKGQKPVLHITTGGGGGNMGSRTPSPLVVHDYMDIHHLRFTVDGDKLNMKAVTPEGELIDEMMLEKIGDNFQPEVTARQVDTPVGQQARLLYHLLSMVNVRRDELEGVVASAPQPGEMVAIKLQRNLLDESKIPAGSKLIVSAVDGSDWQIEAQTLEITKDQWTFNAKAPANVSVSGTRVLPKMQIRLLLQVGDFKFEPDTFDIVVTTAN